MALDGFTIGGGTSAAAPAPAAAPTSGALSGFSIGKSAAPDPAAASSSISGPTALKGFTAATDPFASMKDPQGNVLPMPKAADTTGQFNDFLHVNNMLEAPPDLSGASVKMPDPIEPTTKNPIVAAVTGGTTLKQFGKDFLDSLPGSSAKVSGVINNALITKPSDLLSNSTALQSWSQNDDTNQGKAAAIGLLKGLSDMSALQALQGATAGGYQAPDVGPSDTFGDTILKSAAQIYGAVAGIGAIGEALTPQSAVEAISANVARLPLVGKYLAPFIEPLIKTGIGLAVQTQLDPKLAGDIQARSSALVTSLAETPLYTALGSIKSVWASVPASFVLGYGMSALSGADTKTSVANGALFAMMDGAARGTGERPTLSEEEVNQKFQAEAQKTLSTFSGVKITDKTTAAELKSAYYVAAHRSHPDTGGTNESFTAVKNAYDLLSKGKAVPEAEQSVKLLSGAVKDSLDKNGDMATHQAIVDQLGVDSDKARELINGAKTPESAADIQAVHDKVLSQVAPELTGEEGIQVKGVDKAQATRLSAEEADPLAKVAAARYQKEAIEPMQKEGGMTVIGGDDLKDHFGNDYNDNNHIVYSRAKQILYEKALKDVTNPTVAFTGGGPGSGKTEIIISRLREQGFGGIVMDSNFSSYEGAKKEIEMARAAGKDVRVYGVLPNLDNARGFTLQREEKTGRGISDNTFAHGHSQFPDVIRRLLEDGTLKPEEVKLLDTREINGLQAAKDHAAAGKFAENPLAKAQELNYNKEELNTTYAKENYEKQEDGTYKRGPGQGDVRTGAREAGSETSPEHGAASERGFVNPGQIAEDVAAGAKKVKDTMERIEDVRDLTGDVRTSIYQHENARKAMRVRLTQMIEEVGDALDAQGWENLYHYDENKSEPLNEHEQQVYDNYVSPLKRTLTDIIRQYRATGAPITPDLFFMNEGEYTPRFAKDKQSALDNLIEQGKKIVKGIRNGGLLSKSLGTVSKSRKFYAATDERGKRTVVYVPTDKSENVLAFKGGKVEDMGPVKGGKTPKVKEFFDDDLMRKLNDLASSLGIEHSREPFGRWPGAANHAAGYTQKGTDMVHTRLSAPSVLAHELGHQIDYKYGMQDFMQADRYDDQHKAVIKDEMRALADKRFEGHNVSNNFKSYVRKGSEKMAVMFEAYISNREMFKSVAPHLYDDFRDFLGEHDELRPFLDIQPGLTLGSESHGGNQFGKIGSTFVDKEADKYTIGQATTKEIEANTNVEYHKNVLANYTIALDRATNALNAMRLLERLKNEQEFGEIIKKDSPDESSPEGWVSIGDELPQFRGYHMEPRTAEALTDLAGRQKGSVYIPVFDEVNNLLTTAIVLNPIMHVPNVIAGRSAAAASGDISAKTFKNLARAITEVRGKGPLYLDYLEHGAPFMALKDTTKSFADAILTQYTDEVEKADQFSSDHAQLAKILGYADPRALMVGLNHINESITWGSNDILFMHALMDFQDAHEGSTMEDAIKQVSKRMADYRIPERILLPGAAGRFLSVTAQSRAFMFGRFHYSGVIKPWIESARDSATGTGAERIAGLRTLAYLLLMGLAVWPAINKMWEGITGSPTTYESMPGPLKPVQVAQKLAGAGVSGIPAAIQSVFSPSPAASAALELGFNTDLFTRNPIYGPLPAEGMTTFGTSMVSPLASASRMTPGDFALSLFGVWTPKNVAAKNTLDQMKYDELPALQTEVKKDMAAGNTQKADAEMSDFNTRAIAAWNMYELQSGNSKNLITTEAQKQDFLKTWGIKAPGAVAMAHANALYGNGSLTSKSSLLSNIATYAKAIKVSPAEAFSLIFSGQQIARVANFGLFNPDSTIIVQRAPLSYTEPIKQSQEAADGNADQNSTLELDHVIPLEAGGDNSESNLNLITTAQNMGEQHQFEDFLGSAVNAGKISKAMVREYSIRYKVGQGETLPAQYMADFTGKYGSKTITLAEVEAAVNAGDAK